MCHNSTGLDKTYFVGLDIIDQVCDLSHKQPGLRVNLTGTGDLFCHPGWRDIFNHFEERSVNVNGTLSTNALLLSEEDVDFLWKSKYLKLLNISIDASTEQAYRDIRMGDFSVLKEKLKLICSHTDRKAVRISMVVMRRNLHDIKGFVELAAELGVDIVQYQGMHDYRNYVSIQTPSGFVFDNEQKNQRNEMVYAIELAAWFAESKNILVQIDNMKWWYSHTSSRIIHEHAVKCGILIHKYMHSKAEGIYDELKFKSACYSPWTEISHTRHGWRVCCRAEMDSNLGGSNATLEEAWNSLKMQKVRRLILNGERPNECPRDCHMTVNLKDQETENEFA